MLFAVAWGRIECQSYVAAVTVSSFLFPALSAQLESSFQGRPRRSWLQVVCS